MSSCVIAAPFNFYTLLTVKIWQGTHWLKGPIHDNLTNKCRMRPGFFMFLPPRSRRTLWLQNLPHVGSKTRSSNESFQKTRMLQRYAEFSLQIFSKCSADLLVPDDFLADSQTVSTSQGHIARSFCQPRGRCQWGYPLEAFELDSLGPWGKAKVLSIFIHFLSICSFNQQNKPQ